MRWRFCRGGLVVVIIYLAEDACVVVAPVAVEREVIASVVVAEEVGIVEEY